MKTFLLSMILIASGVALAVDAPERDQLADALRAKGYTVKKTAVADADGDGDYAIDIGSFHATLSVRKLATKEQAAERALNSTGMASAGLYLLDEGPNRLVMVHSNFLAGHKGRIYFYAKGGVFEMENFKKLYYVIERAFPAD